MGLWADSAYRRPAEKWAGAAQHSLLAVRMRGCSGLPKDCNLVVAQICLSMGLDRVALLFNGAVLHSWWRLRLARPPKHFDLCTLRFVRNFATTKF